MTTQKESVSIVMDFDAIHATVTMVLKLKLDEFKLDVVIGRGQYLPLTVQI